MARSSTKAALPATSTNGDSARVLSVSGFEHVDPESVYVPSSDPNGASSSVSTRYPATVIAVIEERTSKEGCPWPTVSAYLRWAAVRGLEALNRWKSGDESQMAAIKHTELYMRGIRQMQDFKNIIEQTEAVVGSYLSDGEALRAKELVWSLMDRAKAFPDVWFREKYKKQLRLKWPQLLEAYEGRSVECGRKGMFSPAAMTVESEEEEDDEVHG